MDVDLALHPLVLLPGVAILVVSTSARMEQLHSEVLRVSESRFAAERALAGELLVKRGRFFRDALRLFYLAIALLSAAGFLGGIRPFLPALDYVIIGLSCVAILAVILAASLLAVESTRSLRSLRAHVDALKARVD